MRSSGRSGTGRGEGGGRGAGTCLPGVDFGEIERERLARADAARGVEVAARLRTHGCTLVFERERHGNAHEHASRGQQRGGGAARLALDEQVEV